MYLNHFIRTKLGSSFQGKYLSSTSEFQKSIQVCVLGAETNLGKTTSFLLKQNPLISTLRLHGDSNVHNMIIDLQQMDTQCRVMGFEGMSEVSKALRGSDVILMLGNKNMKESTTIPDRIMEEGKRVYELAHECINFAPRSIIVINVPPVSVTTPLVSSIYKETNWYHPARIVGSAALAQIKANSILGRYQDLNPKNCQVPIVGGPDIDTAVPLFSRAKPIELNDMIAQGLLARFRGLKVDEFPKKTSKENFLENTILSEAFALNNMLTTIGMGLCGDKEAYCNAFLRTNVISTCQYLVTTLQFSRGGVIHNFGLPQLTKLELRMLEIATLKLHEREVMAKEYLNHLKNADGDTSLPSFKAKEIERNKLLQQSVLKA